MLASTFRALSTSTAASRVVGIQRSSTTLLATSYVSSSLTNYVDSRRWFHVTPVALHGDALSIHKNTAENNPSTPFDFTEENYKKVKQILAKYPEQYKLAATIPLLHLAQDQLGWLPLAAMDKVAKIVGEPPIAIYEVASFYTMFRR